MNQPSLDFGIAVARNSDPDTSWQAANSITDINDRQQQVLAVLISFGPLTDHDLQVAYQNSGRPPQSPSGLRTRRAELVDRGLVVDTGKRKTLPSGRSAILWDIAE